MPYNKRTNKTSEVEIVARQIAAQKEGIISDNSIRWKDVKFYQVVVFGRCLPDNPAAMEVSVAYNKSSLAKEKKNPANLVLVLKSCHPFVSSLTIYSEPQKRIPAEIPEPWYQR